MDQLSDLVRLRKEKQEAYHQQKKKETIIASLHKKYTNLLEMNPQKLAAARIVRFIRRRASYSWPFINISPEEIYCIPGLYFIRFKTEEYFLIGYDLRDIGPLATKDLEFYRETSRNPNIIFSLDQLQHIEKMWEKVNPDTNQGLKFKQDREFEKSMIRDRA